MPVQQVHPLWHRIPKLVLSKQRRFSVKGDKSGAFIAYKEGVKASIDFVNDQIGVWTSEDGKLESCPSFTHIEQTDIDNFLNNALGNSSDITLGKILTQKMLQCHILMRIGMICVVVIMIRIYS